MIAFFGPGPFLPLERAHVPILRTYSWQAMGGGEEETAP